MQCDDIDSFDDVTLFFFGVAIALTLLFFFIASRTEPSKPLVLPDMNLLDKIEGDSPSDDLISKLAHRAIFYGAGWCGFTQKQFDELGVTPTNLKGLNYVECEDEPDRCEQDGIEAFPTWKIDGQLYSGYQDAAKLRALLQK